MNHPFSEYGAASRLLTEYKKHHKLVVGFDFDNTVFDTHNNGGNYKVVIDLLKEYKRLGFVLCLFTSESNEEWLQWKVSYCKHFDIEPDYVNESPLMSGTKKSFFNILLDDRAGLESVFNALNYVVKYANSQSDSSTKE